MKHIRQLYSIFKTIIHEEQIANASEALIIAKNRALQQLREGPYDALMSHASELAEYQTTDVILDRPVKYRDTEKNCNHPKTQQFKFRKKVPLTHADIPAVALIIHQRKHNSPLKPS